MHSLTFVDGLLLGLGIACANLIVRIVQDIIWKLADKAEHKLRGML